MSSSPFPDRELSASELLEHIGRLEPNDDVNDNTTERGRRIVREFADDLGPGEEMIVQSKRIIREVGIVSGGDSPDPQDSRRVGSVMGCINKGIIDDAALAQLDVTKWKETSEVATWCVRVPDDWPEVRDA